MSAFRQPSKSARTDSAMQLDDGRQPWVILAIGNPGAQYADSRHNVGWWVAETLLKRHNAKLVDRGICYQSEIKVAGHDVIVVMPKTYVNRSGAAARVVLQRNDVAPEHMLIICDDINLPVGTIRVRRSGGTGGHNGIASTIAELGTDQFPRLRIGVGKQSHGESQVDHVLGRPTTDELAELTVAVERAADAATAIVEQGVEAAMNEFNQRPSVGDD